MSLFINHCFVTFFSQKQSSFLRELKEPILSDHLFKQLSKFVEVKKRTSFEKDANKAANNVFFIRTRRLLIKNRKRRKKAKGRFLKWREILHKFAHPMSSKQVTGGENYRVSQKKSPLKLIYNWTKICTSNIFLTRSFLHPSADFHVLSLFFSKSFFNQCRFGPIINEF